MTPFEKVYGWVMKPTYDQVYNESLRVLGLFERLVDCEEILLAVFTFFGHSDLIHDAAIEAWIVFYSVEKYR